jgi:hypothetical protein
MSGTYTLFNSIMDFGFGKTTWTPSATLYVGLSTGTILIGGTGAVEPTDAAYARVAVTNSKSYWTAASNGAISNVNAITFPESTASWGTITYVFVADSGVTGGGNVLYYEALSPSRTVASATTISFVAGAFVVTMTN